LIKILHITPHLGGGVGKAVSTLIKNDKKNLHEVICLEKPKEKKFYNKIKERVFFSKSLNFIKDKIILNDIIQIEYWPHPILIKILLQIKKSTNRFIFWCHFSGVKFPLIHEKILKSKAQIIFTTPVSYKIKHSDKKNHKLISSATASDYKINNSKKKNNFLYVGSYHKSKIHPKFLDIVQKNKHIIKKINFYGENELKANFSKIIKKKKLGNIINVNGFVNKIEKLFNKHKFLLYILNRNHYGSAENILIEAMSLGVIPIVLNNDVEKTIVKDKENGILIKDLNYFYEDTKFILKNKKFQKKISKNSIYFANKNYSIDKMISSFNKVYIKQSKTKKLEINFKKIFETNEYNFFLTISKKENLKNIMSKNKCGLKHYLKIFPKNKKLIQHLNTKDTNV